MSTPKIPTQPLRVIDLDSPFIWGVGRDMTDEERTNAEKHGRHDNPPMSVLGIARDGCAGVDGKELAQLFAAAPELLEALEELRDAKWLNMPGRANEIVEKAIARATGKEGV